MYTQDYDETTPDVYKQKLPGGLNGGTFTSGWYTTLNTYSKSINLLLCPDRSDPGCADNFNPTGTCFGYGYNDGWVSDTGYGLLQTQTKQNGITLRNGRNISQIEAPASTVAFGDSYDSPGYSIAMDNIFSGLPDHTSSRNLRHAQMLNYAFVDGHAKTIRMQAGEYSGFGLVAVPSKQSDAQDWCYDPNAVPAAGFNTSGYPLQSGTETCQQAVADFYTGLVTINP